MVNDKERTTNIKVIEDLYSEFFVLACQYSNIPGSEEEAKAIGKILFNLTTKGVKINSAELDRLYKQYNYYYMRLHCKNTEPRR